MTETWTWDLALEKIKCINVSRVLNRQLKWQLSWPQLNFIPYLPKTTKTLTLFILLKVLKDNLTQHSLTLIYKTLLTQSDIINFRIKLVTAIIFFFLFHRTLWPVTYLERLCKSKFITNVVFIQLVNIWNTMNYTCNLPFLYLSEYWVLMSRKLN